MRIVSIGEVLWDVVGETEHLGGAPLNFAAHVSRLGHECHFVSAVGEDERGRRAVERIRAVGLSSDYVAVTSMAQTGHVTVAIDERGQPAFTIHRPAAYDFTELNASQLDGLSALQPQWVYFGTLAQTSPTVRSTTRRVIDAVPSARRFYDVNLRVDSYDSKTVLELLSSATVVKLNDIEIEMVEALVGAPHQSAIEDFCRALAARFRLEAVCVTCGAQGCALLLDGEYVTAPGYSIAVADTIGAGDAFAAALVHGLGAGWTAQHAADFANRLGALVASRSGAIPQWKLQELESLKQSV